MKKSFKGLRLKFGAILNIFQKYLNHDATEGGLLTSKFKHIAESLKRNENDKKYIAKYKKVSDC